MEARQTDEELARAFGYALIGRLFYGPPDALLRRNVAEAGTAAADGALAETWEALRAALESSDDASLRQEYDDLFVSVGKAPVTLYTSSYASPAAPDRHLVQLRDQLAAFGLARRVAVGETEDHIAGICDVMRWLIQSRQGLAAERRFFTTNIAPVVAPLTQAILAQPAAQFYSIVARFAAAFFHVESEAFELDDAA